ncbi:hypothetical protein DYU11_07245 [Fibrisoma montanum]|uniref:Uncharacterized protein n=1 Tax=Fibrisoma montanum TaxID=2305895 RepID=A0A418MEE6_9BACT|nr:hypothetical protein [Fibrisoma montanum]RIV25107.1 hypothetical protein DYU11_07245 [Fibrisoma montanum]
MPSTPEHPTVTAQRRAELLDCIRDNAVNLADAVRQAKAEGLRIRLDQGTDDSGQFCINVVQTV